MINVDFNSREINTIAETLIGKVDLYQDKLKLNSGRAIQEVFEKHSPKSDISNNNHKHLKDNIEQMDIEGNEIARVGYSDDVDFREHFPNLGTDEQKAQLFEQIIESESEEIMNKISDEIFRGLF